MFPSFMGMIAMYNILWQLNMLDSHWGLILVYASGQIPFNTWLVKGYLSTIPKSLDEAAMIDGASKIRIFFSIILPLARPIMVFVALTQFMAPWMDFIFPRLILSSNEKKTLAIGLYDLISGDTNKNFTNFAAGAVLVAVPITAIFMYFQKYFVEGMLAGSTKG
jgi:arabinogalactan oligomer/maltooligosaccharide transport system permease protein